MRNSSRLSVYSLKNKREQVWVLKNMQEENIKNMKITWKKKESGTFKLQTIIKI